MVIVVSFASGLYWRGSALVNVRTEGSHGPRSAHPEAGGHRGDRAPQVPLLALPRSEARSEEHTSELQSRLHLVCRLLLEKKKKNNNTIGVPRVRYYDI